MSGHLVIGMGQVGKAIAAVLKDKHVVFEKDINPLVSSSSRMSDPDMMHICFPYSDTFVEDVRWYQTVYEPKITVIHSTVPVGTSRKLNAVHSPVTGKHPNLEESVRTFTKFFGGPNAKEAAQPFLHCGVTIQLTQNSETTEAGKLWQTLQYGILIALQKEGYKFFESVGADPDVAYEDFNDSYNEGYEKLGEPFRLPIMKDMPGRVGGHCVTANAKITPTRLAEVFLELDETY